MRYVPPTKPPIERFLALTRINSGDCWTWLGAKSKDGYGQFILEYRRDRTRLRVAPYRFIWEWVHDRPMPEGYEPDHTCNNRQCVNPHHVEPVTHSENQKRAYQRGRPRIRTGRPTHCKHGHEYTPENIRINSQKAIVCKTCDRARCKAYQDSKRLNR